MAWAEKDGQGSRRRQHAWCLWDLMSEPHHHVDFLGPDTAHRSCTAFSVLHRWLRIPWSDPGPPLPPHPTPPSNKALLEQKKFLYQTSTKTWNMTHLNNQKQKKHFFWTLDYRSLTSRSMIKSGWHSWVSKLRECSSSVTIRGPLREKGRGNRAFSLGSCYSGKKNEHYPRLQKPAGHNQV